MRTKKTITYHKRTGHPVIHTTKTSGKKYIMVRDPSDEGLKRLYEGSQYYTGKEWKVLKL